jgi:hypothetical protein
MKETKAPVRALRMKDAVFLLNPPPIEMMLFQE